VAVSSDECCRLDDVIIYSGVKYRFTLAISCNLVHEGLIK
jgi:hypothetical protein